MCVYVCVCVCVHTHEGGGGLVNLHNLSESPEVPLTSFLVVLPMYASLSSI